MDLIKIGDNAYRGFNDNGILLEITYEDDPDRWAIYMALEEEDEASVFLGEAVDERRARMLASTYTARDVPGGWASSILDAAEAR